MHFPRYNHNHIENFSYYSVDDFNSKIEYKELDLSVISFNIRGIDCNFDKLVLLLSTLKYQFDVITLVECHIKENELYNNDLHFAHVINNYDKIYVKSKIKYGGIVMYVKKKLSANYCSLLTYSQNTCDALYVKSMQGLIGNFLLEHTTDTVMPPMLSRSLINLVTISRARFSRRRT